ncbi:YwdI family protein [Halobacillus shinanisalinarum]|uniref:YwdI family protein n=1 Tax=Halobacillus shinanisalinarum TaxID=2932258 RepID=A0ABY4H3U9_9BACI|nr:YwdI family protein [Halobacillus shinanisalinarum]UOQ95034.1 YwdI family protein [Halobacillus shinanisalinarum]
MAITNQTILKKMSSEIQEAMLNHGDDQQVREHIRAVKLLSDLVLEEGPNSKQTQGSVQEPTAEEIRKMMGADKPAQKESKPESSLDHDEANGKSIFDF